MYCSRNYTASIILRSQQHFDITEQLINHGFLEDPELLLDRRVVKRATNITSEQAQQIFNQLPDAVPFSDFSFPCSNVGHVNPDTPLGKAIQISLQIIIIFCTLITNSMVTTVLTRPQMRNPTNWILVAIAISEILTAILPLPVYVSAITSGTFHHSMTVTKYYMLAYLSIHLPTAFHIAKVWFNVLLAVQRAVYICYSAKASTCPLCNLAYLKWIIPSVPLGSLLLLLPHIINLHVYTGIQFCMNNKPDQFAFVSSPGLLHSGILAVYKCTVLNKRTFASFVIVRTVIANIIPSVLLIWFTGQLMYAIRKFNRNRRQLLCRKSLNTVTFETETQTNSTDKNVKQHKSVKDGYSTSKMMLVVLGIFLSVEIPTTCFVCYYVATLHFGEPKRWLSEAMNVCNFLILLSYPVNFFVYFAMSRPFRATFKKTFPRLWHMLVKVRKKHN